MQIFLSTETMFNKTMTGLLGNFDGDPVNDLETRDGLVIPSDSSLRTIHYEFGETCKSIQATGRFQLKINILFSAQTF